MPVLWLVNIITYLHLTSKAGDQDTYLFTVQRLMNEPLHTETHTHTHTHTHMLMLFSEISKAFVLFTHHCVINPYYRLIVWSDIAQGF